MRARRKINYNFKHFFT